MGESRSPVCHIRIHQVENDGPDDIDEILDNNFAMIYCKQGHLRDAMVEIICALYIHQRQFWGYRTYG